MQDRGKFMKTIEEYYRKHAICDAKCKNCGSYFREMDGSFIPLSVAIYGVKKLIDNKTSTIGINKMNYNAVFTDKSKQLVKYEDIDKAGVYKHSASGDYIIVFDVNDGNMDAAATICLYNGKVETADFDGWQSEHLEYMGDVDVEINLVDKK